MKLTPIETLSQWSTYPLGSDKRMIADYVDSLHVTLTQVCKSLIEATDCDPIDPIKVEEALDAIREVQE